MQQPPAATVTALLVAVPEAEPVVGAHRDRFDPTARWGVPAHVTVLYPFVPPALVDDDVIARAASAVGRVPAFECTFAETSWFDDGLLWLTPSPSEPLQRLTDLVVAEFPDHPPYGGSYADPVPHLTVGHPRSGTADQLRELEAAVRPLLPIRTRVAEVLLMAGAEEPASWSVLAGLPLAGSPVAYK